MAREPQPVRLWYVAPAPLRPRAARALREFHAVRRRGDRLGRPGHRRRGHRARRRAWFAEPRHATAWSSSSTRSATRPPRPPTCERCVAFLDEHLDELSEDVRRQRDTNPLRAFDTKDEARAAIVAAAPKITDHLSRRRARALRGRARASSTRAASPTASSPTLVRGLDYYERTAWEFKWPRLGAPVDDRRRRPLRRPGRGHRRRRRRRASASAPASSASCWRWRRPAGGAATRAADVFVAITEPPARPRLHARSTSCARGACRGRGRPRGPQRQGPVPPGRPRWARGSTVVVGDGRVGPRRGAPPAT